MPPESRSCAFRFLPYLIKLARAEDRTVPSTRLSRSHTLHEPCLGERSQFIKTCRPGGLLCQSCPIRLVMSQVPGRLHSSPGCERALVWGMPGAEVLSLATRPETRLTRRLARPLLCLLAAVVSHTKPKGIKSVQDTAAICVGIASDRHKAHLDIDSRHEYLAVPSGHNQYDETNIP